MLTYVARRIVIAIPVLFGITVMSFAFVQMMPGDPIQAMMSPGELSASAEYVAQRRQELGLDQPVLVQYVSWLQEVLQGNLGFSFSRRVPVAEMIGARVGPTAMLASAGVGLALLIGVPIGVLAALRQNSLFDYLASTGSMLAISIPSFFLGLIAIYVFAIRLGIMPSGGMQTLTAASPTIADRIRHLLLPAGVLSAVLVGPFVRYTRQGLLEVLHQDYIITARAKGVSRPGVIVRHGLRNGMIPLITVLGLQLPVLFGGVLIIELLFSWPGVGRLAFTAITVRDYPVIMAIVFLSALLVMLFNLLADLLAAVLDPRIRL